MLREFAPGDDLRRVHWKSTARHQRLMIRQDESRRRAPVLVLLDVRSASHDRASFEIAVEAVASIVTSLEHDQRRVEVRTTSGERLGQAGRRHLASLMDELAVIEPTGVGRLAPGGARPSAVVAVLGRPRDGDLLVLERLTRSARNVGRRHHAARRAGTVGARDPSYRPPRSKRHTRSTVPDRMERSGDPLATQQQPRSTLVSVGVLSGASTLCLARVFSGWGWLVPCVFAATAFGRARRRVRPVGPPHSAHVARARARRRAHGLGGRGTVRDDGRDPHAHCHLRLRSRPVGDGAHVAQRRRAGPGDRSRVAPRRARGLGHRIGRVRVRDTALGLPRTARRAAHRLRDRVRARTRIARADNGCVRSGRRRVPPRAAPFDAHGSAGPFPRRREPRCGPDRGRDRGRRPSRSPPR